MRSSTFMGGLALAGMLLAACSGGSSIPPAGTAFAPQALNAMQPDKHKAPANVIKNGTFETGKLAPWVAIGSRAGAATVTSTQHHSGKYSAMMGTTAPPAVNGPHGLEQTVTVPKNGVLSFWHEGNSTDEAKYGYYEVDIYSGKTKLGTCPETGPNFSDVKLGWKKLTCSLAKYAGKKVTLEFYVDDNGYAKADVNWYIDDVTLE
jgi:hypothetical protein